MKVIDQEINDRFALYNGDCLDVVPTLPAGSVHLSLYSPPFAGLYEYSSSERDMSNCRSYAEFLVNYEFLVREITRVTMPGRVSAVHCMEVPGSANVGENTTDFPGDIIRLHQRLGWRYAGRRVVWKEPLGVRNRTMAKGLAHCTVVEDSILADVAHADFLLMFRAPGENPVPVSHPIGLTSYAGSRVPPADVLKYRGWTGKQTENRYSHHCWRQYASSVWDDVRIGRVLPYKESKDPEDERHVHPLQLDVIERAVVLWSNPGETVLTPFMGVGSEVYGAVLNGRRGVGVELKPAYYKQAVRNVAAALVPQPGDQLDLEYAAGDEAEAIAA
jgi:DNA modification methylase